MNQEKSRLDRVNEMHRAYGHNEKEMTPEEFMELIQMQRGLIEEEYEEVMSAQHDVYLDIAFLGQPSQGKLEVLAKELADLEVVSIGMAHMLSIDSEKAFTAVMDSNMSKVAPDGTIQKRPDGKILKGPNYKKPNLSPAIL